MGEALLMGKSSGAGKLKFTQLDTGSRTVASGSNYTSGFYGGHLTSGGNTLFTIPAKAKAVVMCTKFGSMPTDDDMLIDTVLTTLHIKSVVHLTPFLYSSSFYRSNYYTLSNIKAVNGVQTATTAYLNTLADGTFTFKPSSMVFGPSGTSGMNFSEAGTYYLRIGYLS